MVGQALRKGGTMAAEPVERRRRPTMNDVARAAGVSLKSVSRVVNGEVGISSAGRARVERAIRELGYRRNDAAHALRRADGRTACIGLVIEDIGNPFAAQLNRAVEAFAGRRGSLVLAASTNRDPEREVDLVHRLLARAVDGLVIMSCRTDHSYLTAEIGEGLPVVFVDRPPVGVHAPAVLSDNRAGARRATAGLLARGHRRIAFLGDLPTLYTEAERQRGFHDAHAERGVAVAKALVCVGVGDVAVADDATRRLFERRTPPTAIFAANNLIGVGALQAVHRMGRARQVDVVTFDDLDLADVLDPPVTTIRQDPARMGRLAAESIFAALGGERLDPAPVLVPVEIRDRAG